VLVDVDEVVHHVAPDRCPPLARIARDLGKTDVDIEAAAGYLPLIPGRSRNTVEMGAKLPL
jgi:hypothetical protein